MGKLKVVNATSARKNFFQLLRFVSEGNVVVIDKKDSKKKFRIIEDIPVGKSNRSRIARSMAKISIPTTSWEEMKRVIVEKNKVRL